MAWSDPACPMVQDVLEFEPVSLVHKRYHCTAWLPYDEDYCSELYKTVIMQLRFLRAVIGEADSFTVKRSKQAGNALDMTSMSAGDIEGAKEVIAELVNFRIRVPAFKYKYEPQGPYVRVLVSKYKGVDILGTHESASDTSFKYPKNFVVAVAARFGVKIFVNYPDADNKHRVRVAFAGKPSDIALAKDAIEELVANVNAGVDEVVAQAAIIKKLTAEAAVVSTAPTHVEIVGVTTRAEALPQSADTPARQESKSTPLFRVLQRLPSNVIADCNVTSSDNVVDDAPEPSERPVTTPSPVPVTTPPPPPRVPCAQHTSLPPHMMMATPQPPYFTAPSPEQIYNTVFIQSLPAAFANAFHNAHMNAARESKLGPFRPAF